MIPTRLTQNGLHVIQAEGDVDADIVKAAVAVSYSFIYRY